jgi:hypothetical protein
MSVVTLAWIGVLFSAIGLIGKVIWFATFKAQP